MSANVVEVVAYLGLGSNLGDSKSYLNQAITSLSDNPNIKLLQVSRLYQSRPMGPEDQPDYLNAVVSIKTNLSPEALLDLCQSIELDNQRERKRYWGERTLDIDLLCYGQLILETERLTLPHIGLADRDFVLLPLLDIAPELMIPKLERQVKDLVKNCPSFGASPLTDSSPLTNQ